MFKDVYPFQRTFSTTGNRPGWLKPNTHQRVAVTFLVGSLPIFVSIINPRWSLQENALNWDVRLL